MPLLLLLSPGQNAISLLSAGEHEWSARPVNPTVRFAYHRDATPARLVLYQEAMSVQDVEAIRVS